LFRILINGGLLISIDVEIKSFDSTILSHSLQSTHALNNWSVRFSEKIETMKFQLFTWKDNHSWLFIWKDSHSCQPRNHGNGIWMLLLFWSMSVNVFWFLAWKIYWCWYLVDMMVFLIHIYSDFWFFVFSLKKYWCWYLVDMVALLIPLCTY